MARSLRLFLSLARISQTTITPIGSTDNLQSKVCWSGNKHQFQRQITRKLTTSPYLNEVTEVLRPQSIRKCRAAIIECLEEENSAKRLAMENNLCSKFEQILGIKQATSGDLAFAFLSHVKICPGNELHVRSLLGDIYLNGVTYRIRFVTSLWNCLMRYSSPIDQSFSDKLGGNLVYRWAFDPLPEITGVRELYGIMPLLTRIHVKSKVGKLFEDALVAARGREKFVIVLILIKFRVDMRDYYWHDVFDAVTFIRHCIVHPPDGMREAGMQEKDLIDGLHCIFHPIYPMVQNFGYANRALHFINPLGFTGAWDYEV